MSELQDRSTKDLYELLDILDSKASALLAFNGIFLAVLSIWLGYVPLNYLHLILDVVFVFLLVSCHQLLLVVWLVWTPIDRLDGPVRLEEVRRRRTGCYRRAWRISAFGIFIVFLVSVVHTAGTAMIATGNCGDLCRTVFSEKYLGNVDY